MSGTSRKLAFSAIIQDTYHWTPEHAAAADEDGTTDYQDWVAARLDAVMRAAGNAFIAEHPDLFRLDELV